MQTRPTHPYANGFTLVELAAVLAIIGLIVGGVIAGESLIKNTEVKNIVTDFSKYRGAYNQFKTQYGGPPGDIADAIDYWGKQSTTFTCNGTGTSATPGTCNGNGDGTLNIKTDYLETFHAWQQMQLAGYLDTSYTGIPASNTSAPSSVTNYGAASVKIDSVPGSNVPKGKRTASGYSLFWIPTINAGNAASYTDFFYGDYGTVLLFGAQVTSDLPKAAILKPEEAYNIDAKTDDGIAASGKIFAMTNTYTNCVSSSTQTATTATYKTTYKTKNCQIGFKIDQ